MDAWAAAACADDLVECHFRRFEYSGRQFRRRSSRHFGDRIPAAVAQSSVPEPAPEVVLKAEPTALKSGPPYPLASLLYYWPVRQYYWKVQQYDPYSIVLALVFTSHHLLLALPYSYLFGFEGLNSDFQLLCLPQQPMSAAVCSQALAARHLPPSRSSLGLSCQRLLLVVRPKEWVVALIERLPPAPFGQFPRSSEAPKPP